MMRGSHRGSTAASAVRVSVADSERVGFDRRGNGIVGVYDVDWLTQPRFERLLDNLAASPGAFSGVRCFGPFTAGHPEAFFPESGGSVWTDPAAAIDFSATFAALAALTRRGLTPFVALGFFPSAVSRSPVEPPAAWETWQRLVRAFFLELAADPRFGPERIAEWWFEVWNEPNEGRFWVGTPDDYLALYRATAEALAETGLDVRLGGPAIAFQPERAPEDGLPWLERFLRFLVANPDVPCDFLSFHRKGTVTDDPPDPRRLHHAAEATARLTLEIDPQRFRGLTIVNNEADEKVGFEAPYAPRLDHRNAAWLGAVTAVHAGLSARHRTDGLRFLAAADNANLQLVQAPFDGRRSIMTLTGTGSETDLIKLPSYAFYELLRLLGDRQGTILEGGEALFPATGLHHLASVADTHATALLVHYPDPGAPEPEAVAIGYTLEGLPWSEVNVAMFQIDALHSNSYTAAGGSESNPFPRPAAAQLPEIRRAQEVTLAKPIARGVRLRDGVYRERLTVAPFTTICLWITPVLPAVPATPSWLAVEPSPEGTLLRWTPNREPHFFSYELIRTVAGGPAERIGPDPLRAALWVDTAAPADAVYGVWAVTASGVASVWATSEAPDTGPAGA